MPANEEMNGIAKSTRFFSTRLRQKQIFVAAKATGKSRFLIGALFSLVNGRRASGFGKKVALGLLAISLFACLLADGADENLIFKDDGAGSLVFDTGLVKGKLQKDGKGEGLKALSYVPGDVAMEQNHGLLCPYRFLTPEKRYGFGSWEWQRSGRVLRDGAAKLHWAASPDRPFAFTTRYKWNTADTLDFTIVFTPETDLHKFELFLGSYFLGFNQAFALAKDAGGGGSDFLEAAGNKGGYQYFPRDAAALEMLNDGRWKFPPYPLTWAIRQEMAAPLIVRRQQQSGVTVLLMARPEDCFGISMSREDWGAGGAGGATYLSLYGKDMKSGQNYTGRARLVFGHHMSDADAVRRYAEYLKDSKGPGEVGELNFSLAQKKPSAAKPQPSPREQAAQLQERRLKTLNNALRDLQNHNDQETASLVAGIIAEIKGPGGDGHAALADNLNRMQKRVRELVQRGAMESAATLNMAQIQTFVSMDFPNHPAHPNHKTGGTPGPDGLVLYLPFDKPADNGVVRDESGAGNDGQVFGAQWVPDGKFGGAYRFSMTNLHDRIVVSNSDTLNPDTITVAAWVKVPGNVRFWRRIADKDFHHGYDLTLSGDARIQGKPWFETSNGSVGADQTLDDNRWHHVAGTFDGQKICCYVDGVERSRQIRRGPLGKTGWDLCIGNSVVDYGWGEFLAFDGLIDEVRIYNRALSPEEIKDLATAKIAGTNVLSSTTGK